MLSSLLLALFFTKCGVHPIFWEDHWKKDCREFLRETFGESHYDEITVEEFRRFVVPIWLSLAALSWMWFARELAAEF